MYTIQSIKNLRNKVVVLRGDLDAPLKNGKVVDNFRLKRLLPTIEYLNKKGAKIIIMGHLGRPRGIVDNSLTVKPVAKELKKLLGINKREIEKLRNKEIGNCCACQQEGKLEISGFQWFCITGNIILLENLRFYEEEEKNDLKFAKSLGALGDIYVNDAFSVCHRKNASIVGITKYLPSYAGLNLADEIKNLSSVMENPKRPAIAVLGGAKLETKMPLIKELSDNFDYILVGGKLGIEMSKLPPLTPPCKGGEIIGNIILPLDYDGVGKFDIGKRTIKLYSDILMKANAIVWNGPMGKYEDKRYIKGTFAIAKAVAKSKAYVVVGGGDIIASLSKVKMLDKMGFVSTGGGAMLEFLENGTLVGIKALQVKS